MGENTEPLDRVRSAVWGMPFADDALSSSRRKALAKMVTAVANLFETEGITVSEKT